MNDVDIERWLPRPYPRPSARLRLFCFPAAGAGAGSFRTWPEHLPPQIELCPVQLPGRENRHNEPPFSNLVAVTDALEEVFAGQGESPFAFFGHCMGALIAFELARRLRCRKMPMPRCLLLSGQGAPGSAPPSAPLVHLLSDEELLARLIAAGGMPEHILNNERFMRRFLPLARADAKLVESAQNATEMPLKCPVFLFAGRDDEVATQEQLNAWSAQVVDPVALHLFPGGHFYLKDHLASVITAILKILTPWIK